MTATDSQLTITSQQHATDLLLADAGEGVTIPCSRYGRTIHDVAETIYVAALVFHVQSGITSRELSWYDIDYMAGLVVNDHPDPEYLIRRYAQSSCNIDPATVLDFAPSDDI